MKKDYTSKLYNSTAWKQCRSAYVSMVGGLCERCMAKGLITPGREVHHKIHLTKYNVSDPSIALNFDNLELLCIECHNKEHRKNDSKRWEVDENGRIINMWDLEE